MKAGIAILNGAGGEYPGWDGPRVWARAVCMAEGAGRLGFRTVWIDPEEEGWPDTFVPAPSLTVARLSDLLEHC